MKRCKDCGEEKPLADFHKHKEMADGHLNQCRVCRAEWMRAYRQRVGWRKGRGETPPHVACATQARRRARLKGQTCTCCSPEDFKTFYEIRPEGFEVDHIIPLSKGGPHCLDNLQYLTLSDNRRKGARHEDTKAC